MVVGLLLIPSQSHMQAGDIRGCMTLATKDLWAWTK